MSRKAPNPLPPKGIGKPSPPPPPPPPPKRYINEDVDFMFWIRSKKNE